MIQVDIPGTGQIEIRHVVFDFNGTIARDGQLIPGVADGIREFSDRLHFHVLTADTFGSVEKQLQSVEIKVGVISKDSQDRKKLDYVNALGADHTLCVGNGVIDALMLKSACIGIVVLEDEGAAVSAITASDIMVKDVLDVFEYFRTPERLVATLRR